MNPTNQHILMAMVAGYKGGRDLKSILTDTNFTSLPFEDRSVILKNFASLIGGSISTKISALGYAKEMAGGAIKGALATLPLGAMLATVAASIFKDGVKDTALSLGEMAKAKSFRTAFAPALAIGAVAGAAASGTNIYNYVKHQNRLSDGLKGIVESATPEEADQAVANMLFSRALHSAPESSRFGSIVMPMVKEYTKTMVPHFNSGIPYFKGLIAQDTLPSDDELAVKVVGIRDDADKASEDKIKELTDIANHLHKSRGYMHGSVGAAHSLLNGGFMEDDGFVDELSSVMNEESERVGQHEAAINSIIQRIKNGGQQ